MIEDVGKAPAHLPCVEERTPVDILAQRLDRHVVDHRQTRRLRGGRAILGPAAVKGIGARGLDRCRRAVAGLGRTLAHLVLPVQHVGEIVRARGFRQQFRHHAHGLGGVIDMDHAMLVFRRDLQRGVLFRGGRPADQQRQSKPCRFISAATSTIRSSDGVISPESPMISAFSSFARARISSVGTITPMSTTS